MLTLIHNYAANYATNYVNGNEALSFVQKPTSGKDQVTKKVEIFKIIALKFHNMCFEHKNNV